MIKNEKKLYEEELPPLEISEAETLIDESNCRKVYEAPETQEELYSLFNKEKIEGFQDYFDLLDANALGQNEATREIPSPKEYDVLALKIIDTTEEQKKSDALAPKKINSLD